MSNPASLRFDVAEMIAKHGIGPLLSGIAAHASRTTNGLEGYVSPEETIRLAAIVNALDLVVSKEGKRLWRQWTAVARSAGSSGDGSARRFPPE